MRDSGITLVFQKFIGELYKRFFRKKEQAPYMFTLGMYETKISNKNRHNNFSQINRNINESLHCT